MPSGLSRQQRIYGVLLVYDDVKKRTIVAVFLRTVLAHCVLGWAAQIGP